ncbi:MAG: DNA gyrase inhibitor YacG [Rhodocyclaceae bacterium]|nr:DNA gyrase inhibitor YacG [Rhodocyclaceae bacterium]
MTTVSCPICRAPVPWTEASPYRPFCSERCKQIDLGAWANEEYRVPGAEPDPGVEAVDLTEKR